MNGKEKLSTLQEALEKKCRKIAKERVWKVFFPIYSDNLIHNALSVFTLVDFKNIEGEVKSKVPLREVFFQNGSIHNLVAEAILPEILKQETDAFMQKVDSLMDELSDYRNPNGSDEGEPF